MRRSLVSTLLAGLGTLGYYGAYAVIIYLTVTGYRSPAGLFTIGVLTFLAGSFRQSRDLIQRVLLSLSQVYEQSLYLDDLFSFLALEPGIRREPGGRQVPVPIRTGFVFERVGFRYRARTAGRCAGSTSRSRRRAAGPGGRERRGQDTLVKLLARLYDPNEGRILLDGVDLREYDLESVRRNVGVIFQDFVRYDFVLRTTSPSATWRARGRAADRAGRAAEPRRFGGRSAGRAGMTPSSAGGSSRASSCPAASGRRWRWRGPSCGTSQLLVLDEPTAASTRGPSTRYSSVSRS